MIASEVEVREERDPAWWASVASHPAVAPHVFGGGPAFDFSGSITNPASLPLRSENGGIIFLPLDPLATTLEMHTMYLPQGWGREVAVAAKRMMDRAFDTALVVVTYEQQGHYRTRPPRHHGWTLSGAPRDIGLAGPLIGWALTRDQWNASPAKRRLQCQ